MLLGKNLGNSVRGQAAQLKGDKMLDTHLTKEMILMANNKLIRKGFIYSSETWKLNPGYTIVLICMLAGQMLPSPGRVAKVTD